MIAASLSNALLAPMALLAPAARMVPHGELASSFSLERGIFLCFAALVVGGALSTILQRNDVAAVMSLVATFFGLAAVYTFLGAHFIAALQVLVYAGAIMVLFIFVVMVLNRDETDPFVWRGVVGKFVLGVLPTGFLAYELFGYLRHIGANRADAPSAEFGTVAQVGELLFTDYLFAFESVSVLLLIAVIAAVVVARTTKQQDVESVPRPEHGYGDAPTSAGGGH